MGKITKGTRTRTNILKKVNRLFNEKERFMTLDEIAGELNVTKSRITNHFSRKELLMLGLYDQFQHQLTQLYVLHNQENVTINFKRLAEFYNEFMDLFYEYRFTVNFLFVNPLSDDEIAGHIQSTYLNSKDRIYQRADFLVKNGLVNKKILEPSNFEVFLFKHTNLMSTWPISMKLYYRGIDYEEAKPLFLRGILSCFETFLTRKGRTDYAEAIDFLRNM